MTSEQFEALRQWINHRTNLVIKLRDGQAKGHNAKTIDGLRKTLRRIDDEARAALVR